MTFKEAKALLRKEADCQNVPCGGKLCGDCDLYVPIADKVEAIRVVLAKLDEDSKALKEAKEELANND